MRGRVDEREVEQVGRVTRGKVKLEWKRKREGKKNVSVERWNCKRTVREVGF